MNSLHRSGQVTPALRMAARFSNPPWKNLASVSTERQAAPPASYPCAICEGARACVGGSCAGRGQRITAWEKPFPFRDSRWTVREYPAWPLAVVQRQCTALTLTGSKSGQSRPREGEAFFTSAMSPGQPPRASDWALRAPMKSRAGFARFACSASLDRGVLARHCSISTALYLAIERAAHEEGEGRRGFGGDLGTSRVHRQLWMPTSYKSGGHMRGYSMLKESQMHASCTRHPPTRRSLRVCCVAHPLEWRAP